LGHLVNGHDDEHAGLGVWFDDHDPRALTAAGLPGVGTGNEGLVDQNSASWNQMANWLKQVDGLKQAG